MRDEYELLTDCDVLRRLDAHGEETTQVGEAVGQAGAHDGRLPGLEYDGELVRWRGRRRVVQGQDLGTRHAPPIMRAATGVERAMDAGA